MVYVCSICRFTVLLTCFERWINPGILVDSRVSHFVCACVYVTAIVLGSALAHGPFFQYVNTFRSGFISIQLSLFFSVCDSLL